MGVHCAGCFSTVPTLKFFHPVENVPSIRISGSDTY